MFPEKNAKKCVFLRIFWFFVTLLQRFVCYNDICCRSDPAAGASETGNPNNSSAASERAAAGKDKEEHHEKTDCFVPLPVSGSGHCAGGGCDVLFVSSAWGSSFAISSPKRSSFLKNGSFYDIDRGADPDYQISTPEKYYDRQALTDYINSLY